MIKLKSKATFIGSEGRINPGQIFEVAHGARADELLNSGRAVRVKEADLIETKEAANELKMVYRGDDMALISEFTDLVEASHGFDIEPEPEPEPVKVKLTTKKIVQPPKRASSAPKRVRQTTKK